MLRPYNRKINYYETDKMQVVHHSNYSRYMEEARLDMMVQLGLSYDVLEQMGVVIPVLELHNYYLKSMTYGDEIDIFCKIIKLTPVRFTVRYEMMRHGTDEMIHRAETSHAFVDTNFMPMNLKKHYPDVYKKFSENLVKIRDDDDD